ncbi:MAG: hypothetical protein DCC67_02950 [Planctomycetota bacterium]|nr:MAG: hypothetical protein DCC67_02950 [Planctomycetota bacterium]
MTRCVACRLSLIAGLLLGLASVGRAAEGDEEPALGKALATLFNPRTAPTQKTMGLVQRSFLDLVEESRPKLQIALVIDGTDSMSGQLEAVRQSLGAMMNDLELYKENNISYQLVVYRDAGAPSGEVELPLKSSNNQFASDRALVAEAIGRLKAESGAPYFPELVDQGLHVALTELAWSTGDDTSRWILLFGDAPPFDEAFSEPENKAGRRFGAGALVALAAEKGVRINCVLCTSDPEDREPHEKLLDQTRRFMSTLSSKTGGLMLDLSYDDIRAAVRKAAPARPVSYQNIGLLRQQDVEELRRQLETAPSPQPTARRLRVAVLPHLPLERMSFDPSEEAVQLSAELRLRLRAIPGIEFKDPGTVKDRFRRVAEQGVQGEAMLQLLARMLNVDYVLWGTLDRGTGVAEASTGLYDQTAGRRQLLARAATNPSVPPEQLGALLADNLFKSSLAATSDQRLRTALAAASQDPARAALVVAPVALGGGQPALLEGMESLEQSLALPVGPEAAELLQRAHEKLEQAVAADGESALARWLLASCLFNQARASQQAGEIDRARELMQQFGRQLREAYRLRDQPNVASSLRTEIEADYALLLRRNPEDAIKLFSQLIDPAASTDADAARRAYWMLAGIACGDWGVDKKFVDREQAKSRLAHILALWPDSSEAAFIRRALRWDDSKGGAQFPHFPQENKELAELIDRSA